MNVYPEETKRAPGRSSRAVLTIMMTAAMVLILFGAGAAQGQAQDTGSMRWWPGWRGPLQTGEAPLGNPPVRWSEDENIRWKIKLPGIGHATPVVWGDTIFILTAVPAGTGDNEGMASRFFGALTGTGSFKYDIIAIDRKTGGTIWRRTARAEPPHDGKHDDASWASCSPVTDGEHVIAAFGSRGYYCYDMEGNLIWEKDFGDLSIRFSWGEGASPALSGDHLVVTWDQTGRSFITALDKSTGREFWRNNRSDGTSWTTPLIVEHDGRRQVVAPSIRRTRSYDLLTGKIIWETLGMTANPIPTPVAADGIVYLMGGYSGSILLAVSLDRARGDASSSNAIVWDHARDTPYVPSPLLYNGRLYFLKSNQHMLSCFDAKTGREHYSRERLEGLRGVYASPVAAAGRVYVAGRNGATAVLRDGPVLDVVEVNRLDDRFSASPVIVGADLIMRGHQYLYCISSETSGR